MVLIFPTNPQPGDQFRDWIWDGRKWVCVATARGGAIISDEPPENAIVGELWWDSRSGRLYIWTGEEWVEAVRFPEPEPPEPFRLPTARQLSGSGTYNSPAGCKYIHVRMKGGGGGGGGPSGVGTSGGTTSFAGWTAPGGGGGTQPSGNNAGYGGAGSAVGASGTGQQIVRYNGRPGYYGYWNNSFDISFFTVMMDTAFTGFGAGGASQQNTGNTGTGGSGAPGTYVEFMMLAPVSTSYSVGAAGWSANSLYGGSAGVIVVEEYY